MVVDYPNMNLVGRVMVGVTAVADTQEEEDMEIVEDRSFEERSQARRFRAFVVLWGSSLNRDSFEVAVLVVLDHSRVVENSPDTVDVEVADSVVHNLPGVVEEGTDTVDIQHIVVELAQLVLHSPRVRLVGKACMVASFPGTGMGTWAGTLMAFVEDSWCAWLDSH